MKVMVFAAGKGTRLGELTKATPKPLISLGNTTPLMRTLKLLSEAGFKDVVVNVSYLRAQIIAALTPAPFGLNITISDEGDEALETAGGIVKMLPYFGDEPFLCVNADVVWAEEEMQLFKTLPTAFDAGRMHGLLAVMRKEEALCFEGKGDFFVAQDGALTFAGPDVPGPYVYACVQVLNPAAFKGLAVGKRGLQSLYIEWAAQGCLYGLPVQGAWVDMGTPAGLAAAQLLVSRL